MKALITICARKGSKGLPAKNIRPMLGKPLILHTIEQAIHWKNPKISSRRIMVSTDGEEIAKIAKEGGAEVPFLRPADLANDTVGKMPVLSHALLEGEKFFQEKFDLVLDLDPTSPIRRIEDIDSGFEKFSESNVDVCFSVTRARKSPYFNMVEREEQLNKVRLVKSLNQTVHSRQAAPNVWDMNASIYVYKSEFLRAHPETLWQGKTEFFEMPPDSAFDIDLERDFHVVEALMKLRLEESKK